VSGIGAVSSAVLGLLMTALLARRLPIDDFGRVLIVIAFFELVFLLADVRLQDLIFRFYPLFKHKGSDELLRALVSLCLLLGLGAALATSIFVYSAAPWVADSLYDDPSLGALLRAYAMIAWLTAFQGLVFSVLRLEHKFELVVTFQILGRLTTVGSLAYYLLVRSGSDLVVVVTLVAVGLIPQTLPPLLWLVWKFATRRPKRSGESNPGLGSYGAEMRSMLFHTNLFGFLQAVTASGGVVLLGILASPVQVALFGVAQRLTTPLSMMRQNVKTTMTPEITTLWAQGRLAQLNRLTTRLNRLFLIWGIPALVVAAVLARPAALLIGGPEYLRSLPIFFVLLSASYIALTTLISIPLAISMNRLKRLNLVSGAQVLLLIAGAATGLDAVRLAIIQLAGAVVMRAFLDRPIVRELGELSEQGESPANA
jgi:O-antigen/teichoic acid export membrane protein